MSKIIQEKIGEIKSITKQRGISGGLNAIKNRVRWEYYRKFTNNSHMKINMFGYDMYVELWRSGISSTLAMWGIREPGAVSIIKRNLSDDDVAIDIGSNIGYYTLLMNATGADSVVAIEPHPETYKTLRKNVECNNLDQKTDTFNLAISDVSGPTKLLINKRNNLNRLSNQMNPIDGKFKNRIPVQCKTLNDISSEYSKVDFIRMDVEGYEERILSPKCADEVLSHNKPKILFESHPKYTPKMNETLDYIFDLGYSPSTIITGHEPLPAEMEELGYSPQRTILDQNRSLGIYHNVTAEDLKFLLCSNDIHVTRDVFLE